MLKQGDSVFGIQIHVNPHEDVITTFEGMCKRARWFETFNNIYLVYLSPEQAVKDSEDKLVVPVDHEVRFTLEAAARPALLESAESLLQKTQYSVCELYCGLRDVP